MPATAPHATAASPAGSGIEVEWRDLARRARHANPFDAPDMLGPAMRHLAPARAQVLHVEGSDGRLGLVMAVASRQRHRHLPFRVTTTWQHTHHFLGTPLVADDFGVDGWRRAFERVEGWGDGALVLTDVDLDVADDVEQAARVEGRAVRRIGAISRPVTRRRADDDYLARQLSGSRRKELRRVRRRLAENVGGGLLLVEMVSAGRLDEAVDRFLRMEAAGWKGDDGGAIARNRAELAFFRESCHALAAADGLEILALEGTDGQVVAMGVDLVDPTTRFTFKIAYDEQHAAHSPGLLLYMDQLHRFHESGARLLDTCAVPDHPMATRLHPDRRELVTLAVGLAGARGAAVVRATPHLLRAETRARRVVHGVRRRAARAPRTVTSTGTTAHPTPTAPTRGEPTMSLLQLNEESTRALRTAGETGEPQEVDHQLRSHDLLTLEALADLAVSLPEDSIEHNVGALPDVVADGNAPKLEMELRELITNIETNGAWCVLKNIEQDPRYAALLGECLDEIEDLVSGPDQAYNREGFIFLSAPGSMTPSHIDPEHNVLLQIQGQKTMVTGTWASPDARAVEAERLLTGGHRNLKENVQDPVDHVLEPGDGIYVPPYTQHKVINGPALSISLSVTWRSPSLADEAKVLRANSYLRKVGLDPKAPGARSGVDKAKVSAMSAAARAKEVLRRGK